jgi:hypothetical protein
MYGYNLGSEIYGDAAAPGWPAGAPGRLRRGRSRACGSQAGGGAVLPRRCRREPKGLLLYGGEFYPCPLARKHRNRYVPAPPGVLLPVPYLNVTGDTGGSPGRPARDTHGTLTRDITRAHKGTRIIPTNLTSIQIHQHTQPARQRDGRNRGRLNTYRDSIYSDLASVTEKRPLSRTNERTTRSSDRPRLFVNQYAAATCTSKDG